MDTEWMRSKTASKIRKLIQTKRLYGIKCLFLVVLPSIEDHICWPGRVYSYIFLLASNLMYKSYVILA